MDTFSILKISGAVSADVYISSWKKIAGDDYVFVVICFMF